MFSFMENWLKMFMWINHLDIRSKREKSGQAEKDIICTQTGTYFFIAKCSVTFYQEQFKKYPHEHTLFVKQEDEGKILRVNLYVDDLIYRGNDERICETFKSSMQRIFAMTNLGNMSTCFGVEVR